MTTKGAFKKAIVARIEAGLASLSFCKKPVGLSKELGRDASGYVGLPVSTHLPHNRIGIAPVVGVIYSPLEGLLGTVSEASQFRNDATLTVEVGYLTPQKKFMEWVFDPTLDAGSEITKVIRVIEEYGLPFMQEHLTLDQIITELEANRFTVNDLRRYRLPAAYVLAQRKDEARRFIEQELKELAPRTDSAANEFREFAQALMNL